MMSDAPLEAFGFTDYDTQYFEEQADSTYPQKSRSENLTPLTIPHLGTNEFKTYKEVLKYMTKYETLSELPYHIKAIVVDELNVKRHDRSDWREVFSRLEIQTRVIEEMEKQNPQSPTNDMLQQTSHKMTRELLQILYAMKRNDIIKKIHSKLITDKREVYKTTKCPSQETTPASGESGTPSFASPSHLFTSGPPYSPANSPHKGSYNDSLSSKKATTMESENESKGSENEARSSKRKISNLTPEQNTDSNPLQSINVEQLSTVEFHSDCSKQVWNNISPEGMKKTKTWKDFESYFEKNFPEERRQSQLLRLICYILKIGDFENRENKYIKDQDFANMVAWFGPFKRGEDGCLKKLNELIQNSVEYSPITSGSQSFFAGFMSREEAEKCVSQGEEGTFLIRFSSSNACFGSFVITLKTTFNIEHHEIKQSKSPPDGCVEFGGITCPDIATLYTKRLRKEGVSSDNRTSCIRCCPNLPLNAMFKSYKSGPVKRPRGRGRGIKKT